MARSLEGTSYQVYSDHAANDWMAELDGTDERLDSDLTCFFDLLDSCIHVGCHCDRRHHERRIPTARAKFAGMMLLLRVPGAKAKARRMPCAEVR